jgi:pentatricopeptide repeat protein
MRKSSLRLVTKFQASNNDLWKHFHTNIPLHATTLTNNNNKKKNNNNSSQIQSIFKAGKRQEALSEYFKLPHAVSAAFLINNNTDNLKTAIEVYKVAKTHGCSNLYIVVTLMLQYRKQKQNHNLIDDAVTEFNKCVVQNANIRIFTINCLLDELQRVDRVDDILMVVRHSIKQKLQISDFMVSAILQCCKRAKRFDLAQEVWNSMYKTFSFQPNQFHYSEMIHVYCNLNNIEEAVAMLKDMNKNNIEATEFSFRYLIRECAKSNQITLLEQVTKYLDRSLPETQRKVRNDVYCKTALVNMYATCGNIHEAIYMFDTIPIKQRNDVTWNSMIKAYIGSNDLNAAVDLLDTMMNAGINPDTVTYTILLSACAEAGALDVGVILHKRLVQEGVENNSFLVNALVNMYTNCRNIYEAIRVFDTIPIKQRDAVTWSSMMKVYISNNNLKAAVDLLDMMVSADIKPNVVVYVILLTGCAEAGALDVGVMLHKRLVQESIQQNTILLNTLVNMYGNCGNINEATRVFDDIPVAQRNVITWSSMMKAYIDNNNPNAAVDLLDTMVSTGIKPDTVTYTILLTGCADYCMPETCMMLHKRLLQEDVRQDVHLKGGLINMYGKCSRVADAERIFRNINNVDRTIETWATLLQVYALNGLGEKAVRTFENMAQELQPTSITLISVLNACSHTFMVEQALNIYNSMEQIWNIVPETAHTVCVMDALARSGRLDEAEQLLLDKIPDDVVAWTALLGACKSYKDVDRAKRVFSTLKALDSQVASSRILMSNILTAHGDRRQKRSKGRNEEVWHQEDSRSNIHSCQ